MGKLADVLGKSAIGDEAETETDVDDSGPSKAEILAAKRIMKASTPEAYAQALKDFMEACGGY